MRGVRRTGTVLVALLIAGALGASPALARTKPPKKPPQEPPHVRLSSPLGGAPEGVGGKAPWEAEGVTLASSNLLFATSAGNTECSPEVAARVGENTGRFNGSVLGEVPGSLPCNGTVGSEPAELKTEEVFMRFNAKGAVDVCLDPAPYAALGCPGGYKSSALALDVGSLECSYLHSGGKNQAAMIGSFDPASLGSAEPKTVEVTLPAQKFKLAREQRKSPAYSGCPREGQLSGNFTAQTEHDGPLQSRIVDTQQLIAYSCTFLMFHNPCTTRFENYDKTETVEVREAFVLQGAVPKEEDYVRVREPGECVGSAEAGPGQGTILAPGQSCTFTVEVESFGEQGNVHVLTTSTPGGAPGGEFAGI